MTPRRIVLPAALAAASVLVLAGCAGSGQGDDGRIAVVASTDVYGQVVEAIGGDLVDVTSIVSSGAQDPHSFEPSARDQLAVSRADLIVENGGGYDAFIDALIEATGSTAEVVTAVEFSHAWPDNDGHEDHDDADNDDSDHDDADDAEDTDADDASEDPHDHDDHDHVEGFNEHVWYDPHTMAHVAEAIADELAELSPADAATFAANLDDFTAGIAEIEASLADLDAAHAGSNIFVTEPVPLYLTEAAGLVNVSPEAFTEAVEEGQDVPPATLLEALKVLRDGTVKVVVANSQTGGAETTEVIDEAEKNGIPVVEFAETLPDGQTYLSWMQSNVEALAGALAP